MATNGLTLITETEFRSSQYADLAENVTKLSTIIAAAEDHVQTYLDRRIAKATYTEVHYQRQKYLFPREYPVIEVQSLRRRLGPDHEWQTLDPRKLRFVHPEAPILEYVDDSFSGYEVEVVYTAGYDPVPPAIKMATILQTVLMATTDLGVFGNDDGKEPGYKHLQKEVYRYLEPYKRLRRFY